MKDHKEAFLPNMDELSRQYGSTTQSYCRGWQFTTQTTGYIIHCPSLPLQLLSCLCPPSLTNRVGFLIHLIGAQPSPQIVTFNSEGERGGGSGPNNIVTPATFSFKLSSLDNPILIHGAEVCPKEGMDYVYKKIKYIFSVRK